MSTWTAQQEWDLQKIKALIYNQLGLGEKVKKNFPHSFPLVLSPKNFSIIPDTYWGPGSLAHEVPLSTPTAYHFNIYMDDSSRNPGIWFLHLPNFSYLHPHFTSATHSHQSCVCFEYHLTHFMLWFLSTETLYLPNRMMILFKHHLSHIISASGKARPTYFRAGDPAVASEQEGACCEVAGRKLFASESEPSPPLFSFRSWCGHLATSREMKSAPRRDVKK